MNPVEIKFGMAYASVQLQNTYISRASNFRDLSKIAKLNTRTFLELPITISLSA